MATRHRSKDGTRETEEIIGEAADIAQSGRQGGDIERRVATCDEEKRAKENPAGATRVTGQDSRETGHAPESSNREDS